GAHSEPLDDAQVFAGWDRSAALIHPMMMAREVLGIDNQHIALPSADRLAIEAANDDVRIGVGAAVQIDHTHAVHEAAHHVDGGRQLDHSDGPHPRHDQWHPGWPALADVVAIHAA